jgi:integrase
MGPISAENGSTYLKTAWRRYKKHAGVENFRFHDTRHTAATRTLRACNLKVVQELLGREDIATTAKYAHAMIEDCAQRWKQRVTPESTPVLPLLRLTN